MSWQYGRQGGGYQKLLIFNYKKLVDCWLIKIPGNSEVKLHNDPIKGWKHYRLNVVLKQAFGSCFRMEGKPILKLGQRVFLFRPDVQKHSLTKAESDRVWLSIGWAKKDC